MVKSQNVYLVIEERRRSGFDEKLSFYRLGDDADSI